METRSRWAVAAGVAAAAGYGWLKVAWGLGSTIGVTDAVTWNDTLGQLTAWQRFVAFEGTAVLDAVAVAMVVALALGRGGRPLRWLAGAGCAVMTTAGLAGLTSVAGPATGLWADSASPLASWVYVLVYGAFAVLGTALGLAARGAAGAATSAPVAERRPVRAPIAPSPAPPVPGPVDLEVCAPAKAA